MEPDSAQLDIESLERTYDRYASFYDTLFGLFFSPGRKAVIEGMEFSQGDSILEIGIGTGASVDLYPDSTKITGVDLSKDMLSICEERARLSGKNVDLHAMNAEHLDFPDNSFSHVVAMYVVSVSPDPSSIIREMERVCKPGGEIIVLNHFSDENSLVGRLEKALLPISAKIGFRPFFPLGLFMQQCSSINFHEIANTNLFGYWTILRGQKQNQPEKADEISSFDGAAEQFSVRSPAS